MKLPAALLLALLAPACGLEAEGGPDELRDHAIDEPIAETLADDFTEPLDDECTPQACGPAPQLQLSCDDGSTAGVGRCLAMGDGQCGWEMPSCSVDELVAAEPEPASSAPIPGLGCTRLQCGLPPDAIKLCPTGGFVGPTVCTEVQPGACGWTFPPCPDPTPGVGPCGPFECGFFPPLVIDCDGLISHSAECVRQPDGICQWQAPECSLY